jgi:hypothetical protein
MKRRITRASIAGALAAGLILSSPLSRSILIASSASGSQPEGVRLKLDLTNALNLTRTFPLVLVTPAMAANIGPGSHLLIDIPNAGTFGCTANFVWESGGTRYLGAAGHCFIPEGTTATHGVGADFDASGVVVRVCVSNCSFGGQSGFVITGDLVTLGRVAYARQTAADGDIGNDFGVVAIPSSLSSRVRPSMPVFGGPTTVEEVALGRTLCHYGNGVGVGEVFLTMARVGVGGGSNVSYWMGDLAAAPGDSGSGVVGCGLSGTDLAGEGAAGVLTHLGVEIGVEHGVVFGTTIARAIEMAQEADLALALVLP